MTPSLILSLTIVVGTPGLKKTPEEPPKLEGDWTVESIEPAKGPMDKNAVFRFTADKISIIEAQRTSRKTPTSPSISRRSQRRSTSGLPMRRLKS